MMDVFDPAAIQSILRRLQIRPARERGQHFLVRRDLQKEILRVAALPDDALVLEIGPGLGSLTEGLIQGTQRVISIELDRQLAGFLSERFRGNPRLTILQDDIRTAHLAKAGFEDLKYHLVSNLPYQITSLVLRMFLSLPPRPSRLTLVIQKEVAERLIAPKGEKSLLAIATEYYGTTTLHQLIPPEAFWPKPEVSSALITIDVRTKPVSNLDEKSFFRIVKAGFSSRRKQLHNSLAGSLKISPAEITKILEKSHISPTIRPQDLELGDWVRLAQNCLT
jgi:16S rRNA (adenine1518-N6/adenine1519-N6)-dimethyltransferase